MGLRFRRSLRLAPGLRLNLAKRGTSLSIGGRGRALNLGAGGVTGTIGVPGSGISYRARLGGARSGGLGALLLGIGFMAVLAFLALSALSGAP